MPPTPTPQPNNKVHRIDLPLRLQALGTRLAGQPDAEGVMQRAVDLDRRTRDIAHRVGQQGLPSEQRAQLNLELASLQLEFDCLVAEALGEPRPEERARGALAQLSPEMRQHLAHLLRVSTEPQFYPLLELKAAEYIEQGRAFDQCASQFGFLDGLLLGPVEPRGALLLTHNGSLVQLSAPGVDQDPRARRFVYQNIYGGPAPTEGSLKLTHPVRLGEPLRSSRMATSPVRKLRLAVRPESWDRERETFRHVSVTLMRMRAPEPSQAKTMWGSSEAFVPSVNAKSVQLQRMEEAAKAPRAELRELVLRLADPSLGPCDAVHEAQILGLIIHLQSMQAELHDGGFKLDKVTAFVTDRGERCVCRQGHVSLERSGRPAVDLPSAHIGAQTLVRGAPVALLDTSGDIAAVLGDVVWIDIKR